jgi:hypothetical protein
MVDVMALDGMSEDELLDFADVCAVTARRAEVDLIRAAYQWALMHSAQRLDPAEGTRRIPSAPAVVELWHSPLIHLAYDAA